MVTERGSVLAGWALRLTLALAVLAFSGVHHQHSHPAHSTHLLHTTAAASASVSAPSGQDGQGVPAHTDPTAPEQPRALPAAVPSTGHPLDQPTDQGSVIIGGIDRFRSPPVRTRDRAATDLTALGVART